MDQIRLRSDIETPETVGTEGDASRLAVPNLDVKIIIPLKYLSNFLRFLD